jgi:methyl-accepting chemotaxis protein
MFKNLRLGMKIGLGFGCLLLIAMFLGGLAVYKMNGVGTEATMLSDEYVPEVSIANEIERNSLMTMYNMRGYGLTEEDAYLKDGQKYLAQVKNFLTDAKALADSSPHLVKLAGSITEIDTEVNQYEQLTNQTVEKNGQIEANRKQMDDAAGTYMKNCSDFLKGQNDMMVKEIDSNIILIQERVQKTNLVNDIIDLGNEIRLSVWRSQAEQNTELAKQALELFPRAEQKFTELRQITRLQQDIDRITNTQSAANSYKSAINKLIDEGGTESVKKQLDDSAKSYMTNCNDFIKGQNQNLAEEISNFKKTLTERHGKITVVNDIVDIGNVTRLAAWRSQAERSPELIQNAQSNFDEMDKKFEELRALTRLQVDLDRINKTKTSALGYKTAMNGLLTNWLAVQELGKKRGLAGDAVLAKSQEISKAGIDQTANIASQTVNSLTAASTTIITGLIIALLIGIVLATYITRIIVKPLQMGVKFAELVADGDFTQQITLDQKDEIGQLAQALNHMSTNLSQVMQNIQQASEQVAASSEELSAASQNLANGATEQASSIEETSASIEQLSSSIEQNAQNAKNTDAQVNQATQMSSESLNIAQKGIEQVQALGLSMKEIQDSSAEIVNVIDLITDISDQTNLLALNAAIEAARAGEAGKGFAVVAVEVRKLAERSQVAAKDIAGKIAKSSQSIEDGSRMASASNEGLSAIQKSATDVAGALEEASKLVSEISDSSLEQSNGANQIQTAMQQLDQVTQQNSSTSEETASASEELSAQAQSLQEMISQFKISDNSGSSMIQKQSYSAPMSDQVIHPEKRLGYAKPTAESRDNHKKKESDSSRMKSNDKNIEFQEF